MRILSPDYRATVLYEGGQTQVATAPAKFVHEPVVYSGGGGAGAEPYFSFSSPAPVQPHLSPAHNFINTPPPPAPPVHHVAPPLHLPSYRPRPLLRPLHHQPTYFTLPQVWCKLFFISKPIVIKFIQKKPKLFQEHITVFSSPPRPSPHLPPPSPPPPPPPPPSSAPPASQSPTHVAPANKHHLAFSVPLVKPPEHHKEDDIQTPDPYLVSEEELKGKTFDSPFWYPLHRHIIKGYRNKDRGDKEDHRDYKVI